MLKKSSPLIITSLILALCLKLNDRPIWCSCKQYFLSSWDVWTQHNSQHVFDPYSFSHFEHGLIFFFLFLFIKQEKFRIYAALILEAIWEYAENSPFVIDRYRTATSALGYSGDTIINSIADLACCYLGYLFSKAYGWRVSVLVFLIIEFSMLVAIKDNLTLNVIMLLYPIEAIKQWQLPGTT
jgi:hypothetical protein